MKNLNRRQIIILAITVLIIIYAAYDFLIVQPAAKKARMETAKPVEIGSFVNTLSNDLTKDKVSGVDAYVVGRAEMEWGKSPFWERASYREFAGSEEGSGAAKIIYSGYIDAGRKKMAVINGWEYEVGESLDIEGYALKSVTPSSILIVNRNTGGELYVPIQE